MAQAETALPLAEFIRELHQLGSPPFELSTVARRMAAVELSPAELERARLFLDDHHARSLLHSAPGFELILLCWRPGQATVVHDHDGQRGWLRVLEGTLEETPFKPSAGSADPVEGASGVRMQALPSTRVSAGPVVATVDERRAFHRIANPAELDCDAVSLHLYSRPHSSCVVWDPDSRTCRRRQLSFDRTP